ncbi:IS701 family transposase [Actinoplanes sp. CA-015351]|uniref:IS701 family transposase n=1 Tax=Actinoplanes sp. CA-015351 TaxID=3239897 RepID=UPI003D970AF2
MLPITTLPGSWFWLLCHFRACFTAPTFATFTMLVSGMVARPQRRTVTGMLIGAGLSQAWHHCRAHRFFSRAVWSVDQVSMVLLTLVVRLLVPPQAELLIAVDDTLFTRSGRRVAGAGWHHDAATKTKGAKDSRQRWGHCWVVAGIVLELPLLDRPVCLPIAFALWLHTPGSTAAEQSKQALAGRLVTMIAQACPGRHLDVVADCWYAGADGASGATLGAAKHRGLPDDVTLTSRLRANTALHWIATPVPGRSGRPKRIGERIGTPTQLATHPDTHWREATVARYGRTDTVTLADTVCLWYGVYRSRAIRVILLRDHAMTSGYGIAVFTTDLHTSAERIISRYAARWSIEVAFADAKQLTGVGEARNRTRTAIDRTVPLGLITQSLIIVWYHLHGTDTVTARRAEAPWYRTKTRPAYLDMIVQLRRVMIAARILGHNRGQPTPQQIHDVCLAWEQATA